MSDNGGSALAGHRPEEPALSIPPGWRAATEGEDLAGPGIEQWAWLYPDGHMGHTGAGGNAILIVKTIESWR